MSHKRKDTYVSSEWRKHLRPDGKRAYHSAERRLAKERIEDLSTEEMFAEEIELMGQADKPRAKKKTKRKKYGVEIYWKKQKTKSDFFRDGWTTWYDTERARDDAFEKVSKDLERVRNIPNDKNPSQHVGFIFVWGDSARKVDR